MDVLHQANLHDLVRRGPAPRFKDGALLGNGGLGAVVTTRPDAGVVHLGRNDVWDERLETTPAGRRLDFETVLSRVREVTDRGLPVEEDPWFADYRDAVNEHYTRTYPRPYPCGSLVLAIDRRRTEVLGHRLDIARGETVVSLRHEGGELELVVFVDATRDAVHLAVRDASGRAVDSPFTRARLLPDLLGAGAADAEKSDAEKAIALTIAGEAPLRPSVQDVSAPHALAFVEEVPVLPDQASARHRIRVTFAVDRPFAASSSYPSWYGTRSSDVPLEAALATGPLIAELRRVHERGEPREASLAPASVEGAREARAANAAEWAEHWSRSSVTISHTSLERLWYRNTYFLHCCARPGHRAPGLFGNWSAGQVGTAWHGDYHMNYNAQQVYWGVFSSNRAETHEAYLSLVEALTPLATRTAREYFGLPGAAYPHTAYPVPMSALPDPSPIWGWEICETPWVVQSLWWHYLYTQDEEVLRRVVGPLEAATVFMLAYLERPAASGPDWRDDRLHVFPTVVPELYGLTPGLALNRDCLADLTLIRFLFHAYQEAVRALEARATTTQLALASRCGAALGRLAPYPTDGAPGDEVFVSVAGEDPNVVYNVPVPGMTVFPGEDHGVWSDAETVARARRSVARQRLEGGNELVFAALQRARLDILDVDAFVRQVEYCALPNGTATDMVLQTRGRYTDTTPFDFMAGMGVFVENFALPAVVNEMLLQSVGGHLRLFPGLPEDMDAEFTTLRAVGAFLVSARATVGACEWFEVRAEKGGVLRVTSPWPGRAVVESSATGRRTLHDAVIELQTVPGQRLTFTPAADR